jgi:hypothetical protein
MTEGDAGESVAPPTDAARARLVTSYEACELADAARAAVPIGEQELAHDGTVRSPGSLLAEATRVRAAAERFLEAAVVCERVSGASWELIGDVLGLAALTARTRFTTAESRFRKELLSPSSEEPRPPGPLGEMGWWRAHMVREPLEGARDLDDWVLRHDDGDSTLGAAPVSGGLARGR